MIELAAFSAGLVLGAGLVVAYVGWRIGVIGTR